MIRYIFGIALLLSVSTLLTVSLNAQTTFTGTGFGPIPDGGDPASCQVEGLPRDVTFNVTGIPTAPSFVAVTMIFNPAHTWGGDVVVRLISPDNTQFVIFGYTRVTTNQFDDGGDGSDLAGPYTFDDQGNPGNDNWWTAALNTATDAPIPSGTYRTSQIGGQGSTGAQTNLTAAFASIPTSNGTWTLRFTDGCQPDTGSVSFASLTLTGGGPAVIPQKPNADMDGDGKTDFVVVRDGSTGFNSLSGTRVNGGVFTVRDRMKKRQENLFQQNSPGADNLVWWTRSNVGGNISASTLGDVFTDTIVNGDFDGDTKDDVAIWRPTADAATTGFYWINSGNSTFDFAVFGQDGDDPSVVGDYDGDGTDDPATFRCPIQGDTPGPCYFFYRSSINPGGGFAYLPWGYGDTGSLSACPGDYDGDQRSDVCIIRDDPASPGSAQFVFRRSSNDGIEFIDWGSTADTVIPGDFDGDGRSDFCIRREEGGYYNYFILERDGGGTGAAPISWGGTGDIDVPGDYDGDGKQDLAIWRPSTGVYWIRQSSNGQIRAESWGSGFDYPVQNWYVR